MHWKYIFNLIALTLAATTGAWRANGATNAVAYNFPDDSLYLHGRFVYQRNCVICHGERGDGRGQMAVGMLPSPRNFTSGIFKYRSTPLGTLPTDQDLFRTVRQGVSGTSMPAFSNLTERDVKAVVQYIKSYSAKWRSKENYAAPLALPEPPDWFYEPAGAKLKVRGEQGKSLFLQNCVACHGENGGGDGPSSATLVDAWDKPIKPADLGKPVIRSGPERKDIYKAISTGLSGTPMASFADALTPEQRWDLVAFIESLRKQRVDQAHGSSQKRTGD